MSIRPATHAGDWYSGTSALLMTQISNFFKQCNNITEILGARILIGPHAGYTYSGARLAETFASWDTSKVKRVFILGPSHHVYFKGKALVSNYKYYATPFGNLPVDVEVSKKLVENGPFEFMNSEIDQDEHSFELHAPFIYYKTENLSQGIPSIVPIMISGSNENLDDQIAKKLLPYLRQEENTFIISSDFCHWGSRFDYTSYLSEKNSRFTNLTSINRFSKIDQPIYQSIEQLDRAGMRIASDNSYKLWREYILETGNTICGQKAIGIIIRLLEVYQDSEIWRNDKIEGFKWINYSQSKKARVYSDSSVSYASGYLVI